MREVKDIDIAKRLLRTQQSADKRGVAFNLSFARLKQVLNAKKCFFTGNQLTHDNPEDDNYLTLDRIDASKGYVDDNVVACGRAFNMRKGELTVEDVKILVKALKKKKLI
jgi:hypothetical protein